MKELRWAKKAGTRIQPVINVLDKTRIGEFLGAAPDDLRGMIGGIDFVDLNTGDAEYWDVGIDKVLRGAARNNKKLENALQVLKRARSQV